MAKSPRELLTASAVRLEQSAEIIRSASHNEELAEVVEIVDKEIRRLQGLQADIARVKRHPLPALPTRQFDISMYPGAEFHRFDSLEAFLGEPIRDGISEVPIGAVPLHLMFTNRGADTTLVHFAAAVPAYSSPTYPVFPGRPTAKRYKVNHLSLSDPNLSLATRPTTGWFSGSEDQNLQGVLARIIRHATRAGVEDQAILFGSSAGGFAALLYGAGIPGSVTVCANPRIDLESMPSHFPLYRQSSFDRTVPDAVKERIRTHVGGLHAHGAGNTVAYLQNVQDTPYFEGNMIPFLERSPGAENVWMKLIDSGPKHMLPSPDILGPLLRSLVDEAPNWGSVLHRLGYEQAPTVDFALAGRGSLLESEAVS